MLRQLPSSLEMRTSAIEPVSRARTSPVEDLFFSVTDRKGVITEKLLSKPHNVIRHPDMPRCVFKLLWIRSWREIHWAPTSRTWRKPGSTIGSSPWSFPWAITFYRSVSSPRGRSFPTWREPTRRFSAKRRATVVTGAQAWRHRRSCFSLAATGRAGVEGLSKDMTEIHGLRSMLNRSDRVADMGFDVSKDAHGRCSEWGTVLGPRSSGVLGLDRAARSAVASTRGS